MELIITNQARIPIKHFLVLEHSIGQAGWDPILVYDVDCPVASPLDHRRHATPARLPTYILEILSRV